MFIYNTKNAVLFYQLSETLSMVGNDANIEHAVITFVMKELAIARDRICAMLQSTPAMQSVVEQFKNSDSISKETSLPAIHVFRIVPSKIHDKDFIHLIPVDAAVGFILRHQLFGHVTLDEAKSLAKLVTVSNL